MNGTPQRRTAAPAASLVCAVVCAGIVALTAGCASRSPSRDGPDARPPPNLLQVPDAEPRIEPLRTGGPNKPYDALGQRYVPMTADEPLSESGGASWYGRKFHGLPTASGEPYDMYAMTAAHRTMPIPSYARVRNPANGREVIVRINDRGPFSAGRVIDLSYTAALKLGVLAGVAPVQVQRLTFADIRAGARVPAPSVAPVLSVVSAPSVSSVPSLSSLPLPAVEAVATPLPAAPADDPLPGDLPPTAAGVWLQLGAYRLRDGAQQLQQRVLRDADAGTVPGVAVFEDGGWFRVQAGPFNGRAPAQQAAERLRRQLGLAVLLVERAAPP